MVHVHFLASSRDLLPPLASQVTVSPGVWKASGRSGTSGTRLEDLERLEDLGRLERLEDLEHSRCDATMRCDTAMPIIGRSHPPTTTMQPHVCT